MPNRGVAPLDPETLVGQLRLLVGDTEYIALDPEELGYGDYAVWSDDTLAVALLAANDSLYRAAASLYMQLAADYSRVGRSIKTDDLSIDTRARGADLLAVARWYIDRADSDDQDAGNDFFQIVPFSGRPGGYAARPEATPWSL